jgi:hypothetical protein
MYARRTARPSRSVGRPSLGSRHGHAGTALAALLLAWLATGRGLRALWSAWSFYYAVAFPGAAGLGFRPAALAIVCALPLGRLPVLLASVAPPRSAAPAALPGLLALP